MRPSIVGATYELLAFEQTGTFGKFDRCFRKACAFLSIRHDDATIRKLRNIAFWHLRTTGYLDVSYAASTTTWSTTAANLVERADTDFVLIGSSASAAAVTAAAPTETVGHIRSSDAGLVEGSVSFFPDMLRVRAPAQDVKAISHRASIPLSLSYQTQLFQHLPSVDAVLKRAIAPEEDGRPFEPDSTDQFDFASCTWKRFGDTRPFEPGLYRQSFDYGAPPTYVIAAPSRHQRLATFRVKEREWVLVAALALLSTGLPIRYENDSQRLFVSKRYHGALRLPTLLERCLRSGTLLNPSSSRDWFTYEGIRNSSVARLAAKLPIFTVEGGR